MIVSSTQILPLLLAMAAAMAYGVAGWLHAQDSQHRPRLALLLAWLLHLGAIGVGLVSDGAQFGFGPALSVTAWLVLTVYGIEYAVMPRLHLPWLLSLLAAAAVLLGVLYPGQPMVNHGPLMAVHLALGIACYGLFATAVVHGWLMLRAEKRMRSPDMQEEHGLPLLTLERLTFRFAQAGFALLTATLAVGLLSGEKVYGRAWTWSHKDIFSVLAWLTFAALLIARSRMGLRGRRAVILLNAGAVLLLLAYVGSRFVMEVVFRR